MEKYLVSFDGTKICYHIGGKKGNPAVVFLHGWLGNKTHWKKVYSHLQKRDFLVIAPDIRGFGKSDSPKRKTQYSFEDIALDVDLILREERLDKAAIVGYSMGGMIALTFSNLFPKRVASLALFMSGYKGPSDNKALKRKLNELSNILRYRKQGQRRKRTIDFSRHSYLVSSFEAGVNESTPFSVLSSLENIMLFDSRSFLPKIKAMTLVVAGKKDVLVPKRLSEHIAKKIKNSKMVLVDYDHTFPVKYPDAARKLIEGFLKNGKE